MSKLLLIVRIYLRINLQVRKYIMFWPIRLAIKVENLVAEQSENEPK